MKQLLDKIAEISDFFHPVNSFNKNIYFSGPVNFIVKQPKMIGSKTDSYPVNFEKGKRLK